MLTKRLFDLFFSVLGLVLLFPILCFIGLIIKIDSKGPIFFRQNRIGKDGSVFRIYKFRTMMQDNSNNQFLTISNDPRITKVGRRIRKMKLDELPQLLNVIKGEMSLVGPRPEAVELMKYWPTEARLIMKSVKPGMTDEASIFFMNEEDMLLDNNDVALEKYKKEILPKKIKLWKEYIEKRSLAQDFKLIVRTLIKLI
jgi:lipopolysaccharide/colanic/teichoic acid biosynthesis glycosyltransferase